ncbi:hypothetical protein [Cellulomonas sp. T2.31MG-18]|uniref:hypothetical protein n=1 Tax=Cellulomonas sp. T2.31MG-18 TaxID=3157619 RepID=UPI00366FC420
MGGPRRRRSARFWATVGLGAAAVTGCAQVPQPPSASSPATFTYTCCTSADINRVLHPGDVLVLHWIVTAVPPTRTYPEAPVRLSASLTGSFADAAQLKDTLSTTAPSPTVSASPVETTTRAGSVPVSTIAIPADAAPGMYNLTTSVESGGGRAVGEHIVRIEARAAP